MRVTMFMCVSLFPLNYLSNLVWLKYMHLGYVGAAMHFATFHTMVFVVYMTFLLGGTKFVRSYWPGWSQQALHHWKPFLKLGSYELFVKCTTTTTMSHQLQYQNI